MPGGTLVDTNHGVIVPEDTNYFSNGAVFIPIEESCQRYYYHITLTNMFNKINGFIVNNFYEYSYVLIDAWANNGLGAVVLEQGKQIIHEDILGLNVTLSNHLPFTI